MMKLTKFGCFMTYFLILLCFDETLSFSASPRKEQSVFMPWEDQETVDGCEWVGHLASQLRINQNSEEVIPGYRADVARATMWKVCMV